MFLAGDSAIGSPYFQSISLGFECAIFLAGLIAQRNLPLPDMLDRYELYIYKQWLRVYMRSKMIKHNKDLFESLDDPLALLEKLATSTSRVRRSRPMLIQPTGVLGSPGRSPRACTRGDLRGPGRIPRTTCGGESQSGAPCGTIRARG